MDDVCKWTMDGYTDWWAGCTDCLTGWSDREPPKYCPECGREVEADEMARFCRSTCHDVGGYLTFICSECRCSLTMNRVDDPEPTMLVNGLAATPEYCPNCGAKVVE